MEKTEPALRAVVIVRMILLHDMFNRRVVTSLQTYYYITIIMCTSTNTMSRIEGENVRKMILFNKHIYLVGDTYIPTVF